MYYRVEVRRKNGSKWWAVEYHKKEQDAINAMKDYIYLYDVRVVK